MIVNFSAVAEADLEEIGDWIAEGNPDRAISFLIELRQLCLSLAEFPLRFPLVQKGISFELRKATKAGYLIFYIINSNQIDILRIVHGSRDWASIFAEPE